MAEGLAFAFLVVARLAYVIGVGSMLKRQESHQVFTQRDGIAAGFARFKRWSTVLMIFDSVAFILLCVVTLDTMHLPVPRALQVVFGLAIGIFGLAIKSWATRSLGTQSYHWYNFFEPNEPLKSDPGGPYRFLKNPMYGVGYLQTYGLAFICASWPGLIAAAFMQASILVFNEVVEKPHFMALARNSSGNLGTRTAG